MLQLLDSGGATLCSGCSQEHPELEKKLYIYILIKKIICLSLKKLGTPSIKLGTPLINK